MGLKVLINRVCSKQSVQLTDGAFKRGDSASPGPLSPKGYRLQACVGSSMRGHILGHIREGTAKGMAL